MCIDVGRLARNVFYIFSRHGELAGEVAVPCSVDVYRMQKQQSLQLALLVVLEHQQATLSLA